MFLIVFSYWRNRIFVFFFYLKTTVIVRNSFFGIRNQKLILHCVKGDSKTFKTQRHKSLSLSLCRCSIICPILLVSETVGTCYFQTIRRPTAFCSFGRDAAISGIITVPHPQPQQSYLRGDINREQKQGPRQGTGNEKSGIVQQGYRSPSTQMAMEGTLVGVSQ